MSGCNDIVARFEHDESPTKCNASFAKFAVEQRAVCEDLAADGKPFWGNVPPKGAIELLGSVWQKRGAAKPPGDCSVHRRTTAWPKMMHEAPHPGRHILRAELGQRRAVQAMHQSADRGSLLGVLA